MRQLNRTIVRYKTFLILLLLIFFSLLSVLPLFREGFFQSDDGEWMIIRLTAFYDALREGQFPVRWVGRLYHGYGYPVVNFLYPGFLYAGAVIHGIGFGFVNTVKILIGLSLIASSLFVYLWLSKFFSRFSSFVAALIYLYTPYHIVNAYRRGSVGELLAMAILPFIFWQIGRGSILFTNLGVAFLILSHNTLAAVSMPVIILYLLFTLWKKKWVDLLKQIVLFTVPGIGIAAFFWIPALYDLQYTVFFKTSVSEWQSYFSDMSRIGITTILLVITTTLLFIKSVTNKDFTSNRIFALMYCLTIVFLFLATSASTILWEILPVKIVQFPFRLLAGVALFVAFLAAFVLEQIYNNKYRIAIGIFITFLTIGTAYPYITNNEHINKGDMYYATNQDSTTVKNEYMPIWVKDVPLSGAENKVTTRFGEVTVLSQQSHNLHIRAIAPRETLVTVHSFYFPGWYVTVGGNEIPISYQNAKGLIEFTIPEGRHDITVAFRETPIRLFADMVSIFSVMSLIGFVVYNRRV